MGRIVMKIIGKKMRVLSNLCVTVEKSGLGGSILTLVPREIKDSSSLRPHGPGTWIFLPIPRRCHVFILGTNWLRYCSLSLLPE